MEFKFNISNSWDIAFHHGHSAFRLLALVYEVENEYIAKKESLNELEYGHAEYLMVLSSLGALTTNMIRVSTASIMMFQAMMEALINDSLERENILSSINKSGTFNDKWTKALKVLDQDESSFTKYKKNIYTKYRNPLVHPKNLGSGDFDDLSFSRLYKGFYSGWDAYNKLYDGLKHPHSENSWEIMCEKYALPNKL